MAVDKGVVISRRIALMDSGEHGIIVRFTASSGNAKLVKLRSVGLIGDVNVPVAVAQPLLQTRMVLGGGPAAGELTTG